MSGIEGSVIAVSDGIVAIAIAAFGATEVSAATVSEVIADFVMAASIEADGPIAVVGSTAIAPIETISTGAVAPHPLKPATAKR